MGLGNLPCATHRLMVDLARDVKSLTSAMRSSCLELVTMGLHWLVGKPMVSALNAIFSQELFRRIIFYLFAKLSQNFTHGSLGGQPGDQLPIVP